jgi:NitT/TauT family transport system substrate-binding protein
MLSIGGESSMRSTFGLLALLCLITSLLVGGCDSMKSKGSPLRLGLSDWPGHAPFYAAGKLDLFKPAKVEIKGFSSNFDRNRAFSQRRLDVLATPLFDALRIADDGVPLKIVLFFDASSGGDGIVSRKEIAAVRDLKGKRVSAELSAITHFVLLSALSQAGLTEKDVEVVNLSVPEAAEAFARGKLDAATLWDPHLSRLASETGAHKLFTSKEIPGVISDVLIVHKDIAEARPEDVAAIVSGWEKALSAWKARPVELEGIMAYAMNRPSEGLRADFNGLELLDLAKNRELYDPSTAGPSVWKSYATTVAFMQQHKLFKHPPPEAKDILDARFLAPVAAK